MPPLGSILDSEGNVVATVTSITYMLDEPRALSDEEMAQITDPCRYAYELGFRWRDARRRMANRDYLRSAANRDAFLGELGIRWEGEA